MVHGGTGSLEGGTGWYTVVLGQYGSLSHSILRRKTNGDTDQPTDRKGKYSATSFFEGWKIEVKDLQFRNYKTCV